MPITTTRAKDYGFPETSFAVQHTGASDPGLTKDGALDAFMGPVTVSSINVYWEKSSGSNDVCYIKVYDSQDPFDPSSASGLVEPLWIIPAYSLRSWLLSFPDGYTFTHGLSLRATRTGGTGVSTTDQSPLGYVDVRVIGRKS